VSVPLVTIGIPTFDRAADLERVLDSFDREMGEVDPGAVVVLVADNASGDSTAALLAERAPSRPWLRVHRQPENVGPFLNLVWLVENAPDSEYIWLYGDDDLVEPGSIARLLALLRDGRPAWLFLPHSFVDQTGRVIDSSPAPEAPEHHATSASLYHGYHHWLTFLTASIVRSDLLRAAARDVGIGNPFAQFLWYFRAGAEGPCLVAPGIVVRALLSQTWSDKADVYLTRDYVAMYDAGLHEQLTEEEFGTSLDLFYKRDDWPLEHWRRVPVEWLIEAVTRFPQSENLRSYLWAIARERRLRDALAPLAAATTDSGAEAKAAELVEAGERAFEAGDAQAAAARFSEATMKAPVLAEAWNNLAVALHQLGHPLAPAAVDSALFIDPHNADAGANRAAMAAG
jgi:glycosyltransferase involved in cell wall biosynthesis